MFHELYIKLQEIYLTFHVKLQEIYLKRFISVILLPSWYKLQFSSLNKEYGIKLWRNNGWNLIYGCTIDPHAHSLLIQWQNYQKFTLNVLKCAWKVLQFNTCEINTDFSFLSTQRIWHEINEKYWRNNFKTLIKKWKSLF